MTLVIYIYRLPRYFELRDEITIKPYPIYYEDLQMINVELVGVYPMFF